MAESGGERRGGRPGLGYIASWVVTILVILVMVLSSVEGKAFFAVVEGRSMEPSLHTGDVVFLTHPPPEGIEVGDVVVYKRGSSYIIHRVVHVYERMGKYCYVVWGDNRETNRFPDPGDPRTCGQVRFRDPYTGEPVVATGIPYEWIIGVAVDVSGVVVKVPFMGSISLVLRG